MTKQILTSGLLAISLLSLTACPSKSDNNTTTGVAPQGRIQSLQNPGTFCDVNNGSISCSAINPATGANCVSPARSYDPNNMNSFCAALQDLRHQVVMGLQCDVTSAVDRLLTENCGVPASSLPPTNPGNSTNPNIPGQPGNTNPNGPNTGLQNPMKSFQCIFEAQRSSQRSIFSWNSGVPRTVSLIMLDGRVAQTVDLRRRFLGLDLGHFGTLTMTYRPGAGSAADTVTIKNEGLKVGGEKYRMSQTGFAGQEVKLEAQSEGTYMTISCRGTSQFKNASTSSRSNLICSGHSSTVAAFDERVEEVVPMSSLRDGQEIQLSQAVTARINGNGTGITYTAVLDPDYGPTVTSTSALNGPASIKASDRSVSDIDISCNIQ